MSIQELTDALYKYEITKRNAVSRRNGKFVHYTSAHNAINILKNEEVWLRNTNCMADYSEVLHGFKALETCLYDGGLKKIFEDAVGANHNASIQQGINLFNSSWNGYLHNTFITCISEHDPDEYETGRLSMWRAYGGNGPKVALILNPSVFSMPTDALAAYTYPVAYFDAKLLREYMIDIANIVAENQQYLASIPISWMANEFHNFLFKLAVSLKHPGFHEVTCP